MHTIRLMGAGLVFGLAGVAAVAAQGQVHEFSLIPAGAVAKIGSYRPQRLALTAERPQGVTKMPDDLAAPLYGALTLGETRTGPRFFIAVDEPADGKHRLFVDRNANGDLTDDPVVEWRPIPYKGQQGEELVRHMGSPALAVPLDGATLNLGFVMYRFDVRDPLRAALKTHMLYYGDYARAAELNIGGKTYRALLNDSLARGDFRGAPDAGTSGVYLLIDRDGDGRFDPRYEQFDVRKPFNLAGTTYEISGLTRTGDRLTVVPSAQQVAEVPVPVVLAAGRPALVFQATTTAGQAIQFPSAYKGKVVLLDFWATWCGPCLRELPYLTAAYEQYHPKGFEVLGISLDAPDAGARMAAFTRERKMPWAQVHDGKVWNGTVVNQYSVKGIPAAFLVDGDTGMILAAGSQLRGENLAKTIEEALTRKGLR